MKAIEKIDWNTADLDKVIGDYIPMPDGTEHYIEMDLLHWGLLDFMMTCDEAYSSMIQIVLEVTADGESDFDELVRFGIFRFNRTYIKEATGR